MKDELRKSTLFRNVNFILKSDNEKFTVEVLFGLYNDVNHFDGFPTT